MLKISTFLFGVLLMFASSCGSPGIKVSALDHFKRGNQHFKNDQPKAAISEYKLAISLDPDQERFYYNMGLAYYRLVLYKQAADSYWEAISKKPDFAEAWYNLSLSFNKLGESEKAFMAYEKYLNLSKTGKKLEQGKQPVKKDSQK